MVIDRRQKFEKYWKLEIEMTTTLGVEKEQSDLIKRQEKMANASLRTAASEPSQQKVPIETKKAELNKRFSNTVYMSN